MQSPQSASLPLGIARLEHLGVIAATGADAASFLQGQLTNDVLNLSAGEARLAGYCSPKGRLLATFLVWRHADGFVLVLQKDILAATLKRLRMFVLRAKVMLDDASALWRLDGLAGGQALHAVHALARHAPAFAAAPPYTVLAGAAADSIDLIALPPAAGVQRWLLASPADAVSEPLAAGLPTFSAQLWRWLDIQAAIPWVGAATQDLFVPQMINFETLGGVDFKKGCYPGQEVVARSQYLGKLKRRMALAHADSAEHVAAGADVFGEPGGALGKVVQAEAAPGGGIDLLIELPLAALEGTLLSAVSADGPRLSLSPLPYLLQDNEAFVRPRL